MGAEQPAIITQKPTTALSLDQIGQRGGFEQPYFGGAPVLYQERTRFDGVKTWTMSNRGPELTLFEPNPSSGQNAILESPIGRVTLNIDYNAGHVKAVSFSIGEALTRMARDKQLQFPPNITSFLRDIQTGKRTQENIIVHPQTYLFISKLGNLEYLKHLPTHDGVTPHLLIQATQFPSNVLIEVDIDRLRVKIGLHVDSNMQWVSLPKTTDAPINLITLLAPKSSFEKSIPTWKWRQMLVLYNNVLNRPNPPPPTAADILEDMLKP